MLWAGFNWIYRPDLPSPEMATALYQAPQFGSDSVLRIDVNMAGAAEWATLPGIGATLSQRIVNYREARGGFSQVNEIKKVYGLSTETWSGIEPYLFVNDLNSPKKRFKRHRPIPPRPGKQFHQIDINQADAAEWATMPGIGAVLSERIVKYRQKIGGFKQIADLQNVYNLPPETLHAMNSYLELGVYRPVVVTPNQPQVANQSPPLAIRDMAREGTTRGGAAEENEILEEPALIPLDVNQADTAALVKLPGIGSKTAYRIVKYRDLIGFYANIGQLQSVYGLTHENYERMKPYLYIGDISHYRKSDLNTATTRALSYLPSFEQEDAVRFIQARKEKGFFRDWTEVEGLSSLNEDQLDALKTYYHL
ncbi:MAG: helix-hairpin-helix domain-containing protein [Bacteroidota bacterium]